MDNPSSSLKKKDHLTTCAIKFTLGENDSSYYYIKYCILQKEKTDNEVSFIYIGDTSNIANDPTTHVDLKKGYTLTYRINKSNDTIYNTIKEDEEIQKYKFKLFDSLDVELDKKSFKLYVYERIQDVHKWDEVLCFSKEYGLVYGYSKFLKGDKSLIQHSNIVSLDLTKLKSQLKKESKNRQ